MEINLVPCRRCGHLESDHVEAIGLLAGMGMVACLRCGHWHEYTTKEWEH